MVTSTLRREWRFPPQKTTGIPFCLWNSYDRMKKQVLGFKIFLHIRPKITKKVTFRRTNYLAILNHKLAWKCSSLGPLTISSTIIDYGAMLPVNPGIGASRAVFATHMTHLRCIDVIMWGKEGSAGLPKQNRCLYKISSFYKKIKWAVIKQVCFW